MYSLMTLVPFLQGLTSEHGGAFRMCCSFTWGIWNKGLHLLRAGASPWTKRYKGFSFVLGGLGGVLRLRCYLNFVPQGRHYFALRLCGKRLR